jgi:DNA-binding YbaB/EbfC family protein
VFKGLGNLANIGSLIKQAQQMGSKLQQVTEELKTRRAEGSSGGGMITVEVNGIGEVLHCRIDPSLIEAGDRELIEDLLPAAVNQALAKAKQLHAEAMKSMADGLDVPGLNAMLAQLSGGESGQPAS